MNCGSFAAWCSSFCLLVRYFGKPKQEQVQNKWDRVHRVRCGLGHTEGRSLHQPKVPSSQLVLGGLRCTQQHVLGPAADPPSIHKRHVQPVGCPPDAACTQSFFFNDTDQSKALRAHLAFAYQCTDLVCTFIGSFQADISWSVNPLACLNETKTDNAPPPPRAMASFRVRYKSCQGNLQALKAPGFCPNSILQPRRSRFVQVGTLYASTIKGQSGTQQAMDQQS